MAELTDLRRVGSGVLGQNWATAAAALWNGAGLANASALTNTAFTANSIIAVPFTVGIPGTIARMAVNIVTGAAGTCNFGIYSSAGGADGTPYPGSPLTSTNQSQSTASSGTTLTQAQELALLPGTLYWAVISCSSAAAFRAASSSSFGWVGIANALGTSPNTHLRANRTHDNTLPTPFPAGATWQTAASPTPVLFLQY